MLVSNLPASPIWKKIEAMANKATQDKGQKVFEEARLKAGTAQEQRDSYSFKIA